MATVDVFFYGSYLDLDVLAEVDLRPASVSVVTVTGWDLTVAPLANLAAHPAGIVWGILTAATHLELERLYTEHAQQILGGTYLPRAVLTSEPQSGNLRPALTYIADELPAGPASPDYVERIAGPAERYGFPAAYVAHIRSFTP